MSKKKSSGSTGKNGKPSRPRHRKPTGVVQADRRDGDAGVPTGAPIKPTKLRIIGGDMRGRPVAYHGDPVTRPMRDAVRENLFNILGRACRGAKAFDLFGGTGVLGLEAISRGCVSAVIVEPVRRAMIEIRKTTERLDLKSKVTLIQGDAFRLGLEILRPNLADDDTAWIVFLSPPYAMWNSDETRPQLFAIIEHVRQHAPPGSVLVVETDTTFDVDSLPAGDWDIRTYGITNLAFLEPANVCGMQP